MKMLRILAIAGIAAWFLSGCYQPAPDANPYQAPASEQDVVEISGTATRTPFMPATRDPEDPLLTPTPNPPAPVPTQRSDSQEYIVQVGDTLGKIAQRYQVTIDQIMAENNLVNPDQIAVGQTLLIPPPNVDAVASGFKLIPDSELVNSPSNAAFDVETFLLQKGGYLVSYAEDVDGKTLSGIQIVERVALEYSINPRLLLAVLEYQSGWVRSTRPEGWSLDYPMGYFDIWRTGLYKQLSFAANNLNKGYYLWKINGLGVWTLTDGRVVQVDPTLNAGTAGVHHLMSKLYGGADWDMAVSENGVFAVYLDLFGYPFDYSFEPMLPADLVQPGLQLPFEEGAVWAFTGGPHGGWDTGSAWAALDFAPPGEARGCVPSPAWVVASAPGLIVYSDHGAVIQDLDGDGLMQTGWSILYMHIATTDRVAVGNYLEAGDPIGHPSCEGGYSTGTHVHIARRYNGEWIAADGALPFVMDGWTASGYGVAYDGYLIKDGRTVEAWNGRSSINAIKR
jgi:LysM repeat protein